MVRKKVEMELVSFIVQHVSSVEGFQFGWAFGTLSEQELKVLVKFCGAVEASSMALIGTKHYITCGVKIVDKKREYGVYKEIPANDTKKVMFHRCCDALEECIRVLRADKAKYVLVEGGNPKQL